MNMTEGKKTCTVMRKLLSCTILHPKTDKVTISCSVYFDESPLSEAPISESCDVNIPSKPQEKVDLNKPVQESEQERVLTLPKSSSPPDPAKLPEVRRSSSYHTLSKHTAYLNQHTGKT